MTWLKLLNTLNVFGKITLYYNLIKTDLGKSTLLNMTIT